MTREIDDIEDDIFEAICIRKKAEESVEFLEDELIDLLNDPMVTGEERERINNLFEDYLES